MRSFADQIAGSDTPMGQDAVPFPSESDGHTPRTSTSEGGAVTYLADRSIPLATPEAVEVMDPLTSPGSSQPRRKAHAAQADQTAGSGPRPALKPKRRRGSAPRGRKTPVGQPHASSSATVHASPADDPTPSSPDPLSSPTSAAGRWIRRVSSAPSTKVWLFGASASQTTLSSGDAPVDCSSPAQSGSRGRKPSDSPPRSRHVFAQKPGDPGVPPLPPYPPSATGFGQYADGTFIPPSPASSVGSRDGRIGRKASKSVSMAKAPSRSRTSPGGLATFNAANGGSLGPRSPRLEVPGSPASASDRGSPQSSPRSAFRRTYSSNSIRVGKAEVGPNSFEKIKLLGKGDVGKVYLVREKRASLDGSDLAGSPGEGPSRRLYAMKVLSKKEMIKRNKIKRALAEQVRRLAAVAIGALADSGLARPPAGNSVYKQPSVHRDALPHLPVGGLPVFLHGILHGRRIRKSVSLLPSAAADTHRIAVSGPADSTWEAARRGRRALLRRRGHCRARVPAPSWLHLPRSKAGKCVVARPCPNSDPLGRADLMDALARHLVARVGPHYAL